MSPATPTGQLPTFTPLQIAEYLQSHPETTVMEVAAKFQRPRAWFLSLLARDTFQALIDPFRHLLHDPEITATMEERFRSLTLLSMNVLQRKLEHPDASDLLVLKAAEIGTKSLGMGAPKLVVQAVSAEEGVERIATRLTEAMEKQRRNARTIEQVVTDG